LAWWGCRVGTGGGRRGRIRRRASRACELGAGFGVGAEDVTGVVGGDLELLTVGGDNRDMGLPLALSLGVDGRLAEGLHPWGAVADGDVG
jgi:hypothetical protein